MPTAPSSDLIAVLQATDLGALERAGIGALSEVGPFRVEIDGRSVLERPGAVGFETPLEALPGSQAVLATNRPPDAEHTATAVAVVNTHIRLVLQHHLENRVLLAERHMQAVHRTLAFLGKLDGEQVRLGILAACMDIVDASVGALVERGAERWSVRMGMGIPDDMVCAYIPDALSGRPVVIEVQDGFRVIMVPLGVGSGHPVAVALADWGVEDVEALSVLETVSDLGRVALDNAHLVAVAAERQRLRLELEVAGRTQEHLMPREEPRWALVDVAGHSRPSADCGGDYFDFFHRKGQGYVVCVADVSGHGIGAALVMATLRGYLQAALRTDATLDAMMREVSDMLCSILEPWQFVTAFLCEISEDGTLLRYCNAGHEQGLLVKRDGTLVRLAADAPPLGIDPVLTPDVVVEPFGADDVLVIPTDGLAESEDRSGRPVGRDRFEQWVVDRVRAGPADAETLRDDILDAVTEHREGVERADDETLVVVRHRGSPHPEPRRAP